MLTEAAIRAAKPKERPYRLTDGEGMYLEVSPKGGRYWRLAYRFGGRQKTLALGVYPNTTLKLAREKRDAARQQIEARTDPSAVRRAAKASQADTFEGLAREFMDKQRGRLAAVTWGRDLKQLEQLLIPYVGSMPVASIQPPDVLAALRRIEKRGHLETAHRARALAGRVFRYAVAVGKLASDPTRDLKGALESPDTESYAAIIDRPRFGALLRAIDGFDGGAVTLAALKLLPLVATRPGELRQAEWAEFDLDASTWAIPETRMKARRAHMVYLSRQAVEILRELHAFTGRERHVFPATGKKDRPLSDGTLGAALIRLGYTRDVHTPHGFRSSFSSMANEANKNPDVIELMLAHKDRNAIRGIYNRAERAAERQELAQWWADTCEAMKAGGNVVPIRRPA